MGRGIAHAFALAGHEVWLIDVKPRSPGDAKRKALAFACRHVRNAATIASTFLVTDVEKLVTRRGAFSTRTG